MKRIVYIFLLLLFVQSGCVKQSDKQQVNQPKNVILFIGDGMGLAHVTAAMAESEGGLNIERCTHVGLSKTYSASNYVTDSSAGGTAIACGVKTTNGMIGVTPDSLAVESILEMAERNGLATGVVVTCGLTHATPASFVAHQPNRDMNEAIAMDYLGLDIDVCVGGDRKVFEEREDGRNLLVELQEKGYCVVEGIDSICQVTCDRFYGFLRGNSYDIPQMPERGDVLPQAVGKVIDVLSKKPEGFFLMVEGSQIDWAAHGNNLPVLLEELFDFDAAIGKALDFAQSNGETLVIVTADHETGGLALAQETDKEHLTWQEQSSKGAQKQKNKRYLATFATTGHSASMVPIYSYGPGASSFTGIMENTAFKNKISSLLSLE